MLKSICRLPAPTFHAHYNRVRIMQPLKEEASMNSVKRIVASALTSAVLGICGAAIA